MGFEHCLAHMPGEDNCYGFIQAHCASRLIPAAASSLLAFLVGIMMDDHAMELLSNRSFMHKWKCFGFWVS